MVSAEPDTIVHVLRRSDYMSLVEPALRRLIASHLALLQEAPQLKNLNIVRKLEEQEPLWQEFLVEDRLTDFQYLMRVYDRATLKALKKDLKGEKEVLQVLNDPWFPRLCGSFVDS